MELIVITDFKEVEEEAVKITSLFNAGLNILHLRKPSWNLEIFESLLKQIPPKFYKRIVIHSHYKLIEKYNLKGIHLTGKYLELIDDKMLDELFKTIRKRNLTISASFHSTKELLENKRKYDYVFLSPLFNSISKEGYTSPFEIENVASTLSIYKGYPKVIALGGITEKNAQHVSTIGFNGVAVLGDLWTSDNVTEKINKLKNVLA